MARAGRVAILINEIDGVELDCVFEERVVTRVTSTKHPREIDTAMTDHAILEPLEVVITAGISNHNISALSFDPSRISNAYDALVSVQKEMRLLTLNLGISLHQNMRLKDFTRTRTNRSGQVLDFTAVFEESIFVGDRTVTLTQALPQLNVINDATGGGVDRIFIENTSNAGSAGNRPIDLGASQNRSITSRVV